MDDKAPEGRITAAEAFAKDGPLAKAFPSFRSRPGQLALSKAVERALSEKKSLLAEGPCGTGKAFAYLVPAIEHAIATKTRVVISTANIALQDQLVRKDIPAIRTALGRNFSFALIKGRSNYLCRRALGESMEDGGGKRQRDLLGDNADSDAVMDALREAEAWAADETLGYRDKNDAPKRLLPIWKMLSVSSEDCIRKRCPHYENCFAEQAIGAARRSLVVVCNHHYLFAHLDPTVLAQPEDAEDADEEERQRNQRHIFSDVSAFVLDEAHEIPSIARDYFATTASFYRVRALVEKAGKLPKGRITTDRLTSVSKAASEYFGEVKKLMLSEAYQKAARLSDEMRLPEHATLRQELVELQTEVANLQKAEEQKPSSARDEGVIGDAENVSERLVLLTTDLDRFATLKDTDKYVFYLEAMARGEPRLVSKPIHVGPDLNETLFATIPVICTSATLTTSGEFHFIAEESGFPRGGLTLAVGSPFDYRKQTLLVTPELPDPTSKAFADAANKTITDVIRMTRGRTLVLFTSRFRMLEAHRYCKDENLPYELLLQDSDASRSELTETFRKEVSSCLFAVASFWTGIDVPGEALSALVIDRMPFDPPNEPVNLAMRDILGSAAFSRYSLPRMLLKIRQGAGRLIRTETDKGVIVILDSRVLTKRYGRDVLLSLPETNVTNSIYEIERFLGSP